MSTPVEFTKLGLRDGDIIVVRATLTKKEVVALSDAFTSYAERADLKNVFLVCLEPHETIREIDAHLMLKCGWVKVQDDFP